MTETLYKKVGRRYKPVMWSDPIATDALGIGFYLIHVSDNGRMMRSVIHPQRARLLAAAHEMREAIIEAMHKASELEPKSKPITPRQRDAWQLLAKAFGDEFFTLNRKSLSDIVDAGIDALERSVQ